MKLHYSIVITIVFVGIEACGHESISKIANATFSNSSEIMMISAGEYHTCSITQTGAAWCWGFGHSGELGDGFRKDQSTPVLVDVSQIAGNKEFKAISAGKGHTCGIAKDGKPWCWGDNTFGQLGTETAEEDQTRPVPVDTSQITGNTAFKMISSGLNHACGITEDEKAWCWGAGGSGQLGNGSKVNQNSATPVDVSQIGSETTFRTIAAGNYHTCATSAATELGTTWCWGEGKFGQLGHEASNVELRPTQVNASGIVGDKVFNSMTASDHTCGVTREGKVWCWGREKEGQLGCTEANQDSSYPCLVYILPTSAKERAFDEIAAGDMHTCGIAKDGVAWCWGAGDSGQLGNGKKETSYTPDRVITTSLVGSSLFKLITSGGSHTCGITEDNKTWCWGKNDHGQLGDGSGNNSSRPVQVSFPETDSTP